MRPSEALLDFAIAPTAPNGDELTYRQTDGLTNGWMKKYFESERVCSFVGQAISVADEENNDVCMKSGFCGSNGRSAG